MRAMCQYDLSVSGCRCLIFRYDLNVVYTWFGGWNFFVQPRESLKKLAQGLITTILLMNMEWIE